MKGLHNESGQMLIMTAIEVIILIGFLAIAVDVGVLFHTRRHMQIATDAAATSAALNYYNAGLGNYATNLNDVEAACGAIARNGYATALDCSVLGSDTFSGTATSYTFSGSNGVKVIVNEPPQNGYHTGTGYVEVIMSKPNPNYFYRAFSGKATTMIATRAVAGDPQSAKGCIYVNQLAIKGNNSISGPNLTNACGIYVTSTSQSAVNNNDNATTVYADFVYTAGNYNKFNTTPTPTTTNVQNIPPAPYSDTYMPDPNSTDSAGNQLCSSSNTYAGATFGTTSTLPSPTEFYYPTGTTHPLNVYCFSQAVTIDPGTGGYLNFPTGVYVFEYGATIKQGQVTFGMQDYTTAGTVDTSQSTGGCWSPPPIPPGDTTLPASMNTWYDYGALVYNYGGTVSMTDPTTGLTTSTTFGGELSDPNAQLGICSQSGGPYNGLAIVQPPANSNPLFLQFGMTGKSATDCSIQDAALNGYIYAPSADVELQDNGGGLMVTGIVANAIGNPDSNPGGFSNTSLTVCSYNSVNNSTTPLRQITLVE